MDRPALDPSSSHGGSDQTLRRPTMISKTGWKKLSLADKQTAKRLDQQDKNALRRFLNDRGLTPVHQETELAIVGTEPKHHLAFIESLTNEDPDLWGAPALGRSTSTKEAPISVGEAPITTPSMDPTSGIEKSQDCEPHLSTTGGTDSSEKIESDIPFDEPVPKPHSSQGQEHVCNLHPAKTGHSDPELLEYVRNVAFKNWVRSTRLPTTQHPANLEFEVNYTPQDLVLPLVPVDRHGDKAYDEIEWIDSFSEWKTSFTEHVALIQNLHPADREMGKTLLGQLEPLQAECFLGTILRIQELEEQMEVLTHQVRVLQNRVTSPPPAPESKWDALIQACKSYVGSREHREAKRAFKEIKKMLDLSEGHCSESP